MKNKPLQNSPMKTFVSNFKKEFQRQPTDTEKWSYLEGNIMAYNSLIGKTNKK